MKRWVEWTIVLGLGGALATGCVSRQEENAKQVSKPYEPINQKYKSPSASEAENLGGTGGAGDQGVAMPENWRKHPASVGREDQGPYQFGGPQPVPSARRPAPFGVGGGPDNARRLAQEQLENQ